MKIGIDKMGVHIPKLYLDIRDLAIARNVEPDKYTKGLMQSKMAICPQSQDIVTMGAMAALKILNDDDKEKIDMIIVGTESGVDHSKSASTHIQKLIGLKKNITSFEVKQACFGATSALFIAKNHIHQKPSSKVLVIASDISRYEKNSAGESTGGAGAVALLISKNPKIATIGDKFTDFSDDILDFYRPINSSYPIVNGKLSNETYKNFLRQTYEKFLEFNVSLENICFHIPYPKLAYKCISEIREDKKEEFLNTVWVNKEVGNIYTASLYLSLYSLLSSDSNIQKGDNIGMFSYGSGAVAKFFYLTLEEGFKQEKLDLSYREKVDITKYEKLCYVEYINENSLENIGNEKIYFKGIFNDVRVYEYE